MAYWIVVIYAFSLTSNYIMWNVLGHKYRGNKFVIIPYLISIIPLIPISMILIGVNETISDIKKLWNELW